MYWVLGIFSQDTFCSIQDGCESHGSTTSTRLTFVYLCCTRRTRWHDVWALSETSRHNDYAFAVFSSGKTWRAVVSSRVSFAYCSWTRIKSQTPYKRLVVDNRRLSIDLLFVIERMYVRSAVCLIIRRRFAAEWTTANCISGVWLYLR